MPWMRARFKDQDVFAEVDPSGALLAKAGKVAIRWSDRPGAKIYNGGASRIDLVGGELLEIDDGGAKPVKKGAKAGGKGAARLHSGPVPDGVAVAYTDGACRGNPGPAGAGVLLMFPDGRVVEASRSLGHATNNIGELTALDMALEFLDEAGLASDAPAVLHTDSEYSIGVLVRGWKAKKNTELILGIRGRLDARPGVKLAWVRGHVGDPGNERADELARRGSSGMTSVQWSG